VKSPVLEIHRVSDHGVDKATHEAPLPWEAEELAPVAVCIPSIPVRVHQLNRALMSIKRQVLQPERVIVQVDGVGEGAPKTRDRALQKAQSKLVSFLDDDDYFGPLHLAECYDAMKTQRADYVYPWFHIAGPSWDPFAAETWHLKPWNDKKPHQTTITTLVRRELAQEVGFREVEDKTKLTDEGYTYGEDFQFTLECLAKGAKIYHVQKRTWFWVITGWNTSGRPEKWRASENA
jgi:hypothetical protein